MYNTPLMVTCSGSLATINCELRQVRKEATVAVISGAEEWLGQVTTLISVVSLIIYSITIHYLTVILWLSSIDSTDVFIF